ncbi:MAG: putative RND superfamily exporter protein [Cellvibrionaceae bacterium]|jgi:predicted RND superfamily exporter protein
MLNKMISAYFYCVLKKPLITLFVLLLAVGLLSTQLVNVKIDASSDALTLEYDKDLDYFREIGRRYQAGDFLVVTYTPDNGLFTNQTLAHLKKLRDELLAIEGIDGANSILDVPLLYSPPVSLTQVAKGVKTLLDEGIDYQLAKKEFLDSPIYKNMLLGPDGKTTAILLRLATDNHYIELVRERDALRQKRDTGGLTPVEEQKLEMVSKVFLDYRTSAAVESRELVQAVRHIVESYKSAAAIFVGGVTMITADMVDFIASDIIVFGVGIIIFIIIILSVIFRQWQFVFLPLFTCVLSLFFMLGFLGAIDWRLTIISSNFVALLLIVCLMITIHLIVRYQELCVDMPDKGRENNLRSTLQFMFKPCLYTALTTIVAFVSLVVSGIRPVIDFGWMMTIGLSVAFLFAFIIIPAGLMILPKTKIDNKKDNSAALTLLFSKFTEKQGSIVLVVGLIAVVVSIAGISRLKVENRFIDYFHSSTEIHQGMLVIDQQLGGTITLDIILDRKKSNATFNGALALEAVSVVSDDFSTQSAASAAPFATAVPVPDAFSDAFSDAAGSDPFAQAQADPFASSAQSANVNQDAFSLANNYWFTQVGMERIEAVHDYLESLSEVGKVQSLAMTYKVARDLNGKNLNNFELALMGKALPSEITSFLIDPYLAKDREQTRITMRVKETDVNLQRDELLNVVRDHLVSTLGFEEDQVHLTGVLVLYNNMLQSLFSSQILTVGAVFIGILLMFFVLFRSLALSLIALMPNMLAALAVLGGMGLAGIPLDMMTITIAAIAVGIGVDDAVHYIYRYREEFAKEKNYVRAMHNAHGSIGKAMYYTSVTVIVGFSILALSKFIPSIYFGLLTGLAMFAAIVASLTLLPKLIIMFKPLGEELNEELSE